jgi:hypothetical protein
LEGVSVGNKKQLDSLAEYLLTPTINPKVLGLTYATIKYWESKGYLILSLPKEVDEWRKYSVIECLWFEILKSLVDMGCNLEKIAPQLMFAYANFKTVNSTISYTETQMPLMVLNGVKINPLNNFLNHILFTIIARSKATIQFNQQGCQFYFQKNGDKATIIKQAYEGLFTSNINICISDIMFEHILGMDRNSQINLNIFTNQEIQVIHLLNSKDINQIIIKQEDGKIYELNYVEKMDVKCLYKPLCHFITNGYQELSFTTNNNKKASLMRTTKQKF